MIPLIFVATILMLILLVMAFILKIEPLGLIASFGMMAIGVHIGASGVEDINNLLTQALAAMYICVGAYLLIGNYIKKFEEEF